MERFIGPAIATVLAVVWCLLWRFTRDAVPRLWARSGVSVQEIPARRVELLMARSGPVLFIAIAAGTWLVAIMQLIAEVT